MQLALGVEYDGSAFNGFQRQAAAPSVQEALEVALSKVANHPVTLQAAGRTDSGVHATGQIVSFHTTADRPLEGWRRGANSLTPHAVSVHWVREVDAAFQPRFNATARRYMYLFYESRERSPLLDRYAVRSPVLDDAAMHRAARHLLGEHDFTTFRAAGCQSRSPYRRIDRLPVHRVGSLVALDVTANAFVYHMVRNIAGALLQVGLGERSDTWLRDTLALRDRSLIGPTAPPHGLYLTAVNYPGYPFPVAPLPGLLRSTGIPDRFC